MNTVWIVTRNGHFLEAVTSSTVGKTAARFHANGLSLGWKLNEDTGIYLSDTTGDVYEVFEREVYP